MLGDVASRVLIQLSQLTDSLAGCQTPGWKSSTLRIFESVDPIVVLFLVVAWKQFCFPISCFKMTCFFSSLEASGFLPLSLFLDQVPRRGILSVTCAGDGGGLSSVCLYSLVLGVSLKLQLFHFFCFLVFVFSFFSPLGNS